MRNFIEEYVNSGYQLKHILYGINYYILRHALVSEMCRLNNGLKLNNAVEKYVRSDWNGMCSSWHVSL